MMPIGPVVTFRRFLLLTLVLSGMTAIAAGARAQQQESKMLDRIMHPNMDLHYDGFERSFETKASNRDRQANVHPFAFAHPANMKSGDGSFHSRTFDDGRGGFRTENFTTKRATAADSSVAQSDRTFATGAVAVHEDRAAGKSVDSRAYVNSTKPFLVPGKRQDIIDDLRKKKNLSIDQVRDILNKNN